MSWQEQSELSADFFFQKYLFLVSKFQQMPVWPLSADAHG